MKEKFQIMSEEFRQLYTEYDCDYMWGKLVDYQHKTALRIHNSGLDWRSLNKSAIDTIPREFYKKASNEDVIIFLMQKNLKNNKINQLIKLKEQNADISPFIGKEYDVDDLRELRQYAKDENNKII